MTVTKFLKAADKFEIQAYRRRKDWKTLSDNSVSFSGSLRKHPYDDARIILVADPLSESPFYYEFRTEDIAHAEELPSMTTPDGDTLKMARIWVRKWSVGIRAAPFLVVDMGKD